MPVSPPQTTRSCPISGTPTGFTGAWATWAAARCWTVASPSTRQGSPTTTFAQGALTVSLSRPPLSPLCRATPRSSTTWPLAWTVWWCRAEPVVWDRPWGQWPAVRRQIFPQAAVRDTPTFPPAPPRGWTRWTIPSSESGRRAKPRDTTEPMLKAFYSCIDLPDKCWCAKEQTEDQMRDCHRLTIGAQTCTRDKGSSGSLHPAVCWISTSRFLNSSPSLPLSFLFTLVDLAHAGLESWSNNNRATTPIKAPVLSWLMAKLWSGLYVGNALYSPLLFLHTWIETQWEEERKRGGTYAQGKKIRKKKVFRWERNLLRSVAQVWILNHADVFFKMYYWSVQAVGKVEGCWFVRVSVETEVCWLSERERLQHSRSFVYIYTVGAWLVLVCLGDRSAVFHVSVCSRPS